MSARFFTILIKCIISKHIERSCFSKINENEREVILNADKVTIRNKNYTWWPCSLLDKDNIRNFC